MKNMKKYTILLYTLFVYFILTGLTVFLLIQCESDLKFKSINLLTNKYGAFITFLITVLIAPIIEELIFRLSLKHTPFKLYLSSLLGVCFYFNDIYLLNFKLNNLIFSLLLISILFLIIKFAIVKYSILENKKNLRYYSYLLAVLFGMYHFKMIININYFSIFIYLYIIPKIILGIFLNHIRLNYGMRYNIIMHMFINLLGSINILIEILK